MKFFIFLIFLFINNYSYIKLEKIDKTLIKIKNKNIFIFKSLIKIISKINDNYKIFYENLNSNNIKQFNMNKLMKYIMIFIL